MQGRIPPPTHERRRLCRCACLAVWLLCAASSFATLPGEDNVGRFPESPLPPAAEVARSATSQTQVPPPDPFLFPQPEHSAPPALISPGWPAEQDFQPQVAWPENSVPLASECGGVRTGLMGIPATLAASCGLWGPWFAHSDPDDPARHIGLGEPLYGTSWLNRPHFAGAMFGGMVADDAIDGAAELQDDGILSLFAGCDFDHYFGGELRISAGDFALFDSPSESSDPIVLADLRLLYYPWGDARWRPYYAVGFGVERHDFTDNLGRDYNTMLLHFPLGIGVKYLCHPACAVRLEATHYLSVGGGGLSAMDHFTLTGGLECHWGGPRKSYFPY